MTETRRKNIETKDYVLFLTSEFSQWYPSDFTSKEGHQFNCAEQYMMHSKAMLFGDHETAAKILLAETPGEQKQLGREVKNFDQEVWEAHAQEIVYQGNYYKFTQNPHLWQVLEKTGGKELVEAAHYDPVWGIGLRAEDPAAQDKSQWKGKNWLGGTLTKLRDDLTAQNFAPAFNDENRIMFRMYDENGQRWLYIGAKEMARQFNMDSTRALAKALEEMSESDDGYDQITLDFKGHGELSENPAPFVARHKEEIAMILVMSDKRSLENLRRNPAVKKKYGL